MKKNDATSGHNALLFTAVLVSAALAFSGCQGARPHVGKLFQPQTQEHSRFDTLSPYGRRQLADAIRQKAQNCRFLLGNCAQQLRALYDTLGGSVGGTLAWIREGKPTRQASQAIDVLKNAANDGLNGDDYESARWDERLARIRASTVSERTLIDFDVSLTRAVMTYLSDLHGGRLNPQQYHAKLDVDHRDFELSEFVANLIHSETVAADMRAVEPPIPAYKRAAMALASYRQLAATEDGGKLPTPSSPLAVGQAYAGMARLRRVLAALGDLPQPVLQPAAQNAPDPQAGENLITQHDADALRRFQSRHGLEATGKLNQATIAELNVPAAARVQQLALTMERWRWLPHELPLPPIVVNIPAFWLRAGDESARPELAMKVMVGDSFDHKTPVFASQLSAIVLRPEWDVPVSITKDEMADKIERDPNYLAKNNFEVVGRTGTIDAGRLSHSDIAALKSGELRLRQKSGPDNALGPIKFEFPNPYSVYLHGTPAAAAFARQRRDLSHGCVRVEDPVRLAAWVLRDNTEWDADKIADAAAATDEETVRIKTPAVPVLILYMTAEVDDDGTVHFYRDIYGDDEVLQNSLVTRSGPVETPRTPAQSD